MTDHISRLWYYDLVYLHLVGLFVSLEIAIVNVHKAYEDGQHQMVMKMRARCLSYVKGWEDRRTGVSGQAPVMRHGASSLVHGIV